jgi:hypothetical protein
MSMAPEMRASDRDRQVAADRLKAALAAGRLDFAEYDRRLGLAYGATTYGDLDRLFTDLPKEPHAPAAVRAAAQFRRAARGDPDGRMVAFLGVLPIALKILWWLWGTAMAINLLVWTLVAVEEGEFEYFWPVWLLVPGTVLLGATVATNSIRRGRPGPEQLPPGQA